MDNYRWWRRNDDDGEILLKTGIDDGGITPNAPTPGEWNELTQWEDYQTIESSANFSFSLKCKVYDARGGEVEDIHSGYVSGGGGGPAFPKERIKAIPGTYALTQNYPNLFNPTTTIRYELPEASSVSIVIYDLGGREIVRWTRENESAGYKQFYWDATNTDGKLVPAGVYVYQLTAQSQESD